MARWIFEAQTTPDHGAGRRGLSGRIRMSEQCPDLFLETLQASDPTPLTHRLRREDPVHYVPSLGFWVFTRHDDVKWLLSDPEYGSRDRSIWEHFEPREAGSWLRWFDDNNFARRDPIAHAKFRRRFINALTPRAVRRMDAQIREVVERFAAPLRDRRGDVIDLVTEFTNPIPNTVISRVTGVPPGDDEVRFRELAQGLIRGFFPFSPPDVMASAEICLGEMAEWVREMAAERRKSLGEDLISDLLRAQEQDDSLDDDEIIMLITLLIGAGSETTNFGSMAMIQSLIEHPEALERLRADRSLIPQAMGELLRFATGGGAAGGLLRWAGRDFEHRGKKLEKGQMLLLSFGAANRDPEVFPDPDRLDLDRDTRDSLVFGHGAHYCLGANLAKQEMGDMIDAAIDILTPGSRLRADLQQHRQLGLASRPCTLPVEIAR
jgi:cytochrome P450